ncbi:hypothetical protein ACFVWL_09980 [Microbacterium sp. NPDC058269]|uniref:hypothetical protein n=1 Tax=Microbacterium sp. NPDC058269 TaxID=3346414 RepID=UPI0036D8935A
MRGPSRPHILRRNVAAVLLGVTLMASLAGCSFIAGDLADDEVEEIPAALLASDIGIAKAGADKAVSGFNHYLAVNVYLDDDELTDAELASILQIIVDENDLPIDELKLGVVDVNDEDIDLDSMMERLVPGVVSVTVGDDVRFTMDGAREIIDAVNTEQS